MASYLSFLLRVFVSLCLCESIFVRDSAVFNSQLDCLVDPRLGEQRLWNQGAVRVADLA